MSGLNARACLPAAASARHRPELAGRLLGAAESLRDQIGGRTGTFSEHWNPRTREVLLERLGNDALLLHLEHGRNMTLDEVLALALDPLAEQVA